MVACFHQFMLLLDKCSVVVGANERWLNWKLKWNNKRQAKPHVLLVSCLVSTTQHWPFHYFLIFFGYASTCKLEMNTTQLKNKLFGSSKTCSLVKCPFPPMALCCGCNTFCSLRIDCNGKKIWQDLPLNGNNIFSWLAIQWQ